MGLPTNACGLETINPMGPCASALLPYISSSICYNPNIGFTTKCEVQGPMRPRMCLGVKQTLINGGECKG